MTPELELELRELRLRLDEAEEMRRAIMHAELDGFVIGRDEVDRNVVLLGLAPGAKLEPQSPADEAKETVGAIRRGEVDAFVIRDQEVATLTYSPNTPRGLAERVKRHEAADARTRKFLGMLAHELRNMLSTMQISVDTLRRDRTGETAEKTLDILERRIGAMKRLVDDLSAINPQD